jgi:hypothetical protein
MLAMLEKQGVDTDGISYAQARELVTEITGRWDKGLCSFKQTKLLKRYGIDASAFTRDQASKAINEIAANNWKAPRQTVGSCHNRREEVLNMTTPNEPTDTTAKWSFMALVLAVAFFMLTVGWAPNCQGNGTLRQALDPLPPTTQGTK